MKNRPVWFIWGSASVSDAGERVSRSRSFLTPRRFSDCTFLGKVVSARRRNSEPDWRLHAGRARYPIRLAALLIFAPIVCLGQETSPSPSPSEAEAEPVVVSATRFDIPLDQSPASVSVISSEDLEQKQIERVSDALREVPGLSVVQTGTAGQLTSVFMRGLPSEDMQVLLDGIPINQGLSGAMNFADFTTDDIDRIEVVRGPQSTIYGPRALAGVIQIFTKQGTGTPGAIVAAEGGSYDTFREWAQSDGKVDGLDYSTGVSRVDTDNARPNNNYRNSAGIADVGWSPNDQLRIGSLFTYSVSDTGNPNTIFDPRH
jgi:vitamin B12 transporter